MPDSTRIVAPAALAARITASVLLGILAAATINGVAPGYTADVMKSVQATGSSSAFESLFMFLKFISGVFRDSASGPLVSSPVPNGQTMCCTLI